MFMFLSGLGSKEELAGKSCKDIREKYPYQTLKNGYYWLNLKSPVKVFCDMTVDKGSYVW